MILSTSCLRVSLYIRKWENETKISLGLANLHKANQTEENTLAVRRSILLIYSKIIFESMFYRPPGFASRSM